MFDRLNRMFWKALTPDLVPDQSSAKATPQAQDKPVVAAAVLSALGGEGNLKSLQHVALTRLRVELHDSERLDTAALRSAGIPGVMTLPNGVFHLLVGLQAQPA